MAQANGFGHRTLNGRPNLLRAVLLETTDPASPLRLRSGLRRASECLVLESNIDDTNPELIGALAQKLMDQGALDTFTTAIQMKKQRPGVLLTVLCRPDSRDRIVDLIFSESTTFGIRSTLMHRRKLTPSFLKLSTEIGELTVKLGALDGRVVTVAPEYEVCRKIAEEKNLPLKEVYARALDAYRRTDQSASSDQKS